MYTVQQHVIKMNATPIRKLLPKYEKQIYPKNHIRNGLNALHVIDVINLNIIEMSVIQQSMQMVKDKAPAQPLYKKKGKKDDKKNDKNAFSKYDPAKSHSKNDEELNIALRTQPDTNPENNYENNTDPNQRQVKYAKMQALAKNIGMQLTSELHDSTADLFG